MDSMRDSLDRLFAEQEFISDETGCLEAIAELVCHSNPAFLLLGTIDGRARAAWRGDATLPLSMANTLAATLASHLGDQARSVWPTRLAGQVYQAFAVRLSRGASCGMLGGVVAAGAPAWETLWPALEVAGAMAWRHVELQRQVEEMRTHIRHFEAEHDTLAAAHTEAMVSVIEEQERRLREERERLAMERAYVATEAANRAKSQFLAHMSHEIRTPLNAILGFTDLLRRGADQGNEAERQEYLETIYHSSLHLLELINDVLDLSKIEAGQMKFERITCSPVEIVASVMGALRIRAEQKGLAFTCHWQGVIPATFQTDPLRVKQLLINLVGNAVKFTAQGEVRLVISLGETAGRPQLRFDVIDTGIGIAAEELERVFDAFVQGDNSITREYGGTGLGLAISRQIARALGGDIVVSSELGRGSVFTATVDTGPLAGVPCMTPPAQAILPKTSSRPLALPVLPPSQILVVEDGHTNRKLFRLILERAGAVVSVAENGVVGLQMALERPFDAILMDMQMPMMDGYTATQRLREAGLTVPVIALTAHAMTGDELKCRQAGCTRYLSKPVEADRLIRTIAECLAERGIAAFTDASPAAPSRQCSSTPEPQRGASILSSLPGDDPEYHEIIEEFVERLKDHLTAMEKALAASDLEELARLAHWLKGSAGTAGFDVFTEPGKCLETLAKEGQIESAGQQLAVIRQLASRILVPVLTVKELKS